METKLKKSISAVLTSVIILTLSGCSGLETSPPIHPGSMFRTRWNSRGFFSTPFISPDLSKKTDYRKQMLAEVSSIRQSNRIITDFGEQDILNALKKLHIDQCNPQPDNLIQLVQTAKTVRAYHTRRTPKPGDIVLFHNQTDLNRNSKNDDWFTGSGIVLSSRHGIIKSVSRTQHQPKEIIISPSGPMVHTYQGKTVNSFIKIPSIYDTQDALYLAGQLYAGYIDIEQLAKSCTH